MESEETQNYVREANDMDQEEGEETSFVPSAISVPEKPLSRRDNQRSENTLSFWQLASVVIKECEESYTTKSCKKCFRTIDKVAVVTSLRREEAHRGRLWKMIEKEQYVLEMWEYCC